MIAIGLCFVFGWICLTLALALNDEPVRSDFRKEDPQTGEVDPSYHYVDPKHTPEEDRKPRSRRE